VHWSTKAGHIALLVFFFPDDIIECWDSVHSFEYGKHGEEALLLPPVPALLVLEFPR
jgi:hypothetical protein